ncbi:hypothetical protein BDQ17DRAFT_1386373 [Cyathus striatus]|nr:hypothetical protein BDQ17DRAFT_1386373 [Cyathus striatus]
MTRGLATVQEIAKTRIKQIDLERPVSPFLIDPFQRRHDYLRISLTERCNLRCFYCMPSEGIELSPDGKLLTNSEILRLASLFVRSGITKIRLTGGEPTVRKGLEDIIASLNDLRPYGLKSIAMTSNGLALHRRLPILIRNGLTHLNLSLDTLDPFKFEIMTRRRGHEAVLRALNVALASSLQSVKLNVVVVKGLNDHEIFDFVDMTKEHNLSVRFIEFMPFTGNKWNKQKMIPSTELLERINLHYSHVQRVSDELNDTARSWSIPGYTGTFGFISSMSDHFCSSCNRLRITADGQIKVCLFDAKELSLRDRMRDGATDGELLSLVGHALSGKQEKHVEMEDIDVTTNRPMILIGGTRRKRVTRPNRRRYSYGPMAFVRHHYSDSSNQLTHLDAHGRASMVDVSDKPPTKRTATAQGRIFIPHIAYKMITATFPQDVGSDNSAINKATKKGDALTVAQISAIMGAKKTSDLIPLCHPLSLSKISVMLRPEGPKQQDERYSILCVATVSCEGNTGVEMEALTSVSVGLLTVWDMLKAVAGKEMEISEIFVSHKSGGRSGDFERT